MVRAESGWSGRGTGPAAAETLKRALGDPKSAEHVRADIAHENQCGGGAENVIVFDYRDKSLYGKSFAEIARGWKLTPVEAAIRMPIDGLPAHWLGGARDLCGAHSTSVGGQDQPRIGYRAWTFTAARGARVT